MVTPVDQRRWNSWSTEDLPWNVTGIVFTISLLIGCFSASALAAQPPNASTASHEAADHELSVRGHRLLLLGQRGDRGRRAPLVDRGCHRWRVDARGPRGVVRSHWRLLSRSGLPPRPGLPAPADHRRRACPDRRGRRALRRRFLRKSIPVASGHGKTVLSLPQTRDGNPPPTFGALPAPCFGPPGSACAQRVETRNESGHVRPHRRAGRRSDAHGTGRRRQPWQPLCRAQPPLVSIGIGKSVGSRPADHSRRREFGYRTTFRRLDVRDRPRRQRSPR